MAFYTTVTGQVLDPSGFAYANGSFSLTLVLPTGIGAYPTFIGGGPIPGVIAGGALDASGNLPTLSVPDNNDINPPGTKWQFNILNSSGLIGFTAQVTITGTSQSVTAALQAVSASLTTAAISPTTITFPSGVTIASTGTDTWDGITVLKTTSAAPGVGALGTTLVVQNNKTSSSANVCAITAVEGVARARADGDETTLRGGHFRTYIDDTLNGTAITSVGVDASPRASGAVLADAGTAFVGVRAYMAPGFTAGTLANVTNCHAFWAYNEHATNAITNAFYVSDEGGGGGFTYGINLYGTAGTSIKTADIKLSNGQLVTVSGGSVCLNDSAQTTAGGVNKLSITLESLTNALTGSQVAFNGRSNNKVAAMTGACEGAHLLAANYEDSPSGTLRGLYTGILLKGKDINVARGFEVIVDSDDTEVIGTELAGGYIVVQTGSTQTFSGIATGLHVRHSATAGGGGKNLKSMIMLDSESNERGAAIIIDAADLKQTPGTAGNASYVCLFAAKDSDGTLRYVRLKNDGTLDTTTTWP
jgi:hypothetical protein